MSRMKAAVCQSYGPPEVLRLQSLPLPACNDDEVLIRIEASTVNSGDWRVRSLQVPAGFRLIIRLVFGWHGPRQPVLGTDLVGRVVSAGKNVSRFKAGDPVFGYSGTGMGCHAEFRSLPADGLLLHRPAALDIRTTAALTFGGSTALDFLRRARLQPGERVLVNGASGCVGSATVQLAKHFGARVAAVCSGANAGLVRTLGADEVIDYTVTDCCSAGQQYDLIVDCVGNLPYRRCRGILAPGGRLLQVVAGLGDMLLAPWVALTSRHRVIAGPVTVRREDLQLLAELAATGRYRPLIDSCYSLDQIVAAHSQVETGHKRGSVVLLVGQSS